MYCMCHLLIHFIYIDDFHLITFKYELLQSKNDLFLYYYIIIMKGLTKIGFQIMK